MSEYLPLEVQEEILKRLPVKPLIQFRSVSKPWKSLIDSPEFIAAYGVRETHPNRLILRYKDITDGEETYLTFVDNVNDHSFTRQDYVPTVPDLNKTLKCSNVVGSSHGLLCFNGYYYKYPNSRTWIVVLWNPSISRSIGIEVPDLFDIPINHVIGFGVCPHTLDPTILMIECFRVGFPWKVGVFTLSTGTWSILSTNLPRKSIRLTTSQVAIDRFIHWLAFEKLDDEDGRSQSHCLIMSFDVTAKEFKEINLSDSLTSPLCGIQTISKLGESLVLLAYHRKFEEDESVCWCLWMMKEQGDSISFTKLYTINLPDTIINRILGFRKTGELILETRDERSVAVEIYDPNSEAIDNLALFGEKYQFFMCSYMETVLLLDQLDGFIYLMSHCSKVDDRLIALKDVLKQGGTACH